MHGVLSLAIEIRSEARSATAHPAPSPLSEWFDPFPKTTLMLH